MTVRIGIVGAGAITERAFLPGFAEPDSPQAASGFGDWAFNGCLGAQVVMLADLDHDRAVSLARQFGVPQVTTDWRDVIANREVDAVCVTTPNYLHCEMAVAACRAGKHVLVEKPLAGTMREADEMVAAADAAGVVFMVEQVQRFFPIHEVAKQVINAGVIGQVLSMRARFSHAGPEYWSPRGKWFLTKSGAVHGAMFDLGVHKFDLIRFLTGKRVAEVSAFTATLAKEIEVEDHGVAILRFADGALGVVEASWASSPWENSLKLYGTAGNLQIGVESAQPISVEFATPLTYFLNTAAPQGEFDHARYVPFVPKQSLTGGPFRHFVDCIAKGEECLTPGADNRRSLEISLAAFKSQETGQVVRLPLDTG